MPISSSEVGNEDKVEMKAFTRQLLMEVVRFEDVNTKYRIVVP